MLHWPVHILMVLTIQSFVLLTGLEPVMISYLQSILHHPRHLLLCQLIKMTDLAVELQSMLKAPDELKLADQMESPPPLTTI